MIPLIDVTLVLLIFFMITAVPGASAMVDLPEARMADIGGQTDYSEVGITIDLVGKGKNPDMRFSLSMGNVPSDDPNDQNIQTVGEALERLKVVLEKNRDPVQVTINAHQDVRASVLLQMIIAMDKPPLRNKITNKYRGVTGKS
jgi:biopolymer transport protein ExbD